MPRLRPDDPVRTLHFRRLHRRAEGNRASPGRRGHDPLHRLPRLPAQRETLGRAPPDAELCLGRPGARRHRHRDAAHDLRESPAPAGKLARRRPGAEPRAQGRGVYGLGLRRRRVPGRVASVRDDRMKNPRQITIFGSEIEAFGGAERSLLALSRWLHERDMQHRRLLYYDDIHLSFFSGHPVDVLALNPERRVMHKIGMLQAYFEDEPEGAPAPLMSGIQAAMHASLAGLKGFHTL